MKTIRIAIIGAGGAGLAQIDYFQSVPGAEVVLLFDPEPDAAAMRLTKRQLPSIEITSRFEQALERRDIDLISICTPDNTHADYAVRAFEAGKHVLVEKPLAGNIEDCARIVRAWRKAGTVGAVQHQFRFEPWFLKAVQAVRDGRIGQPFSIRGEYVHNLIERSKIHHPWRFESPESHPIMVGAGVHFIDLFRHVLQSDVTEVTAISNHIAFPEYPECDCIEAIMKFSCGAVGSLTVAIGVNHPIHFPLRVFGTKATIANGWLASEDSAQRLVPANPILEKNHPWIRKARKIYHVLRDHDDVYGMSGTVGYDHIAACTGSLRNVINAIQENCQPLATIDEGARAAQIAIETTRALREGRSAIIPPTPW